MRKLSVSSQQLHLAMVVVAVFVIVALAIPLLVIWHANAEYERLWPEYSSKGKMISVTEEELNRLNEMKEQPLQKLKALLAKDAKDPYFDGTPVYLQTNRTTISMNPEFCTRWARKYNKNIDQPLESEYNDDDLAKHHWI